MKRANQSDIFKQILFATIIVIICALVVLYIFDIISIPILENIHLKIAVTICVCILFIIYLVGVFNKKWSKFNLVFFSIILEILGYWWAESWIGYTLIIVGLFLIPSFIKELMGKI